MTARWLCLVLSVIVLFPFCAGACPVECCPDTHHDADHHGDEDSCGGCFCLKVVERPGAQAFSLPDGAVLPVPVADPVDASARAPAFFRSGGSSSPRYLAPFLLRHAFLF